MYLRISSIYQIHKDNNKVNRQKKLTWGSNKMKQRRKMPSQQSFNFRKADDVKITVQKEKNYQIMDKDFWQQTENYVPQ